MPTRHAIERGQERCWEPGLFTPHHFPESVLLLLIKPLYYRHIHTPPYVLCHTQREILLHFSPDYLNFTTHSQ